MPACPLCNCSSLPTISLYLTHIRLSHADTPGFTICCGLQGCRRSFTNFLTYRNHVYARHDLNVEVDLGRSLEVEKESGNEGDFDSMEGGTNTTDTPTMTDDLPVVTEDSLPRAAAIWILKARDQHRIPLSVMDTVIGDFRSLYQVSMTACRHKVATTLAEVGVSEDAIASAMVHMDQGSPFTNVFRGLETQHQQLAYFRRHFGLVVSIVVVQTEHAANDYDYIPQCLIMHMVQRALYKQIPTANSLRTRRFPKWPERV